MGGGFALLGSPQCGCCSSVQGLQLTSHSCWGLMTEHCKSQQRGHFLNSAGFALIGSGTAILTAYLIASWEKLPLKCESKHVDCRRKSWLSDTPDEKAYFFMFYIVILFNIVSEFIVGWPQQRNVCAHEKHSPPLTSCFIVLRQPILVIRMSLHGSTNERFL